ncbi:MAG: Hpt domain-containing protein [Paracoccus sp. (in: a-proteobacteria)]|nr:Hpt domain-containing protein [Paracoccus sp. (in: a-proteobacteria)]
MIDWKRVAALRAELGEAEFPPVVELFMDEIEGVVMRLAHSTAEKLESDLHFLRGSAANLGFASFGARCHQGEVSLRADSLDGVDLAALLECYAATKREFVAAMAAPSVPRDDDGDDPAEWVRSGTGQAIHRG